MRLSENELVIDVYEEGGIEDAIPEIVLGAPDAFGEQEGVITVIDAPCGAGKTSWAIQYINAHPEESFVYCTPFLGEIERIREACGEGRFREPHNFGTTKIQDFNSLLAEGVDIAVTHSTFINATPETGELIEEGEYTMILDEVLEVISDFNKIASVEYDSAQKIKPDDIRLLQESGLIEIKENCLVDWVGKNGQGSKYSEVERLSKLHRLYCARDKLLVCVFPPEIFQKFKRVYVMTYMLGGSDLKRYFDLFRMEFVLASIKESEGNYELSDYMPDIDIAFRQRCKELIQICDSPRLNGGYKVTSLSKTWFEKNMSKPEVVDRMRKDLTFYFTKQVKAKAGNFDIMWTCPTEFRKKVQGKGYTCVRQLRKKELSLPETKREKIEKKLTCFVPLNAKATNDYCDRWALAYCANMRLNPMIKGFYQDCGIEIDEDLFALSCFIQWIFRSRIRKGENIVIYIPSPRMRKLLEQWLDCKI